MGESKPIESLKKKSTFREYAEAAVIAIVLALFIRTFIVQAFKIPSGSMKPTLLIGDHLLVNKFIYGIKIPFADRFIVEFSRPKRGDIVVFKWPMDESKDFIKRVVGIGGDEVEIKENILYVNDERIKIEYVGEYIDTETSLAHRYIETFGDGQHDVLDLNGKAGNMRYNNFGPIIVPEGNIFVMGDNRDNSEDSRRWGYVTLNKIKGKALIIYWSWPNWKRFLNVLK